MARRELFLAWTAFIAFGAALSLLTPLGEGFDEPWHFAYVQRVAQAGDVPLGHSHFVSRELARFLELHPLSWGIHETNSSVVSYEEYWSQDAPALEKARSSLAALRFSGTFVEATGTLSNQYERHQPPLYYLLASPVFSLAARFYSFVDVFVLLRLWSVLVASLIVPGAYLLARQVFPDSAWTRSILLLTVVFPGLYSGMVRVSNDALAVPVACWLLACLIGFLETRRRVFLFGLTALMMVGLWTKAFFIPLCVGTLVVLLIYRHFRESLFVLAAACAGVVWYVRNWMWTGSATGLPETVASGSSLSGSIEALGSLDWQNVLNTVRFSHIWIGNWSFLGVRGWMYQVISWMFLIAFAGCVGRAVWKSRFSRRALVALLVTYGLFVAALAYYATQVFQDSGASVAQGWYLTSMIPVEAVLFAAGTRALFSRRWPVYVALFGLFLLALNLYADSFVMFPYYAGITAHTPSGHLQTFHPAPGDFQLILDRLLRFQPWLPRFVPVLLAGFYAAFWLWAVVTLMRMTGDSYHAVPTESTNRPIAS